MVGYSITCNCRLGDVVPITTWGKIFAGFISLIGIGIVAIPTGIISASFVEEIHHFRKKDNY